MIVETAGDLRRLGMMDDASHENITRRHLGKGRQPTSRRRSRARKSAASVKRRG
jgi:hypothetical protein